MKKLFILLFVLLYSLGAYAVIDERKTDIYFANGILTDEGNATANTILLKRAIQKDIYKFNINEYEKHIGRVIRAYNETHGMGPDLIESLLQKIGMQGVFDWLFETAHERNLNDQVETYRESIKNGHKVLVVAHSQGNLFTYNAYDDIDDWMRDYFEVVSVASPAMFPVKENTPLISWDNDLVAYLGLFNSKMYENSVRKIDWKLDYTQYPVGFVPPPGSRPAGDYSYASELGAIVERDCSTDAHTKINGDKINGQ